MPGIGEPKGGRERTGGTNANLEYLRICIGQMLPRVAGYQMRRTVAWRQEPRECRPNVDLHRRCDRGVGFLPACILCPTKPRAASKMDDLIVIMKRYGEYLSEYLPGDLSSREEYRCEIPGFIRSPEIFVNESNFLLQFVSKKIINVKLSISMRLTADLLRALVEIADHFLNKRKKRYSCKFLKLNMDW